MTFILSFHKFLLKFQGIVLFAKTVATEKWWIGRFAVAVLDISTCLQTLAASSCGENMGQATLVLLLCQLLVLLSFTVTLLASSLCEPSEPD